MSKGISLKRIFERENYTNINDWVKITKPIDWASAPTSLTEFKTRSPYIKLERREEMLNVFETCENYILNLSDNWDGYGAQPINEETIKRAYNLLENVLEYFWKKMIEISIPLIQPVSDGSIDINWENDEFELLINISPESNKQVNLYGEKINSPEDEIEMHIPYDLVESVIKQWLKKIH